MWYLSKMAIHVLFEHCQWQSSLTHQGSNFHSWTALLLLSKINSSYFFYLLIPMWLYKKKFFFSITFELENLMCHGFQTLYSPSYPHLNSFSMLIFTWDTASEFDPRHVVLLGEDISLLLNRCSACLKDPGIMLFFNLHLLLMNLEFVDFWFGGLRLDWLLFVVSVYSFRCFRSFSLRKPATCK